IISVQTMTSAAITSGALTLSETYVLTREAFEDYFDHLTPDGILMITRPQEQLPRLFTTARELFESRAAGSPAGHLLAFSPNLMPYGARRFHAGLLMKKSPFTADELKTLSERLEVGRIDPLASQTAEIFYPPEVAFVAEPNPIVDQLAQIVTAPDLAPLYASTW